MFVMLFVSLHFETSEVDERCADPDERCEVLLAGVAAAPAR